MFEPNEKGDKPLDPAILAAAQRADPDATIAMKALMKAEKSFEEARIALEEARTRVGTASKVLVINAAPKRTKGPARKLTPQLRKQYCALLAQKVTGVAAAEILGVAPQSIHVAASTDPEFAQAIKWARAAATAPVVEALFAAAEAGNVIAIKYILENMDPENWFDRSKKIEVAVSGQIESLTPGDRAAQIERIAALEARLAERLALRAAGDQIEEDLVEDAEIEDAPQIEGDDR